MALSNDLISQFAKVVVESGNKNTKTETTAYGTIVSYDGVNYVKIDGSEMLTPFTSTTEVSPGERVTVLIKNHTAIVTGNISNPSASTGAVREIGDQITEMDIVIAGKVDTVELNAVYARIDTLVSDNVIINEKLTANEAEIDTLKANNVTINEKLTANEASIQTLYAEKLSADEADLKYATIDNLEAASAEITTLKSNFGSFETLTTDRFVAIEADIQTLNTEKLSATDADLKYANIDFSNISNAAMEYFYAKSGLIDDVTIGDATITGTLVGVTIKGDLIEANTLVADKLVIQGEDGLYYKLNTDGMTVEANQTDYNSLNGSIITANSITASKISVDDLVAFDATIGGFHITDHSLYSGVKESVDNTTRGTFLDSDGQIAFGDSNQYVKFYKQTDGTYTLDISAKTIKLASSNKTVETVIKESIDGIDVGGQNLLLNSSFYDDTTRWDGSNGTSISITEIDEKTVLKCDPSTGTQSSGYVVQTIEDVELSREHTVSAKIYVTTPIEIAVQAWYTSNGWQGIKAVRFDLTTGWNDVFMTFTSNSSINNIVVGFGTDKPNVFYLYHPKLEVGNVVTDWAPSPNDNINGYATKDEVQTAVDDISIGGRNLIVNSSLYQKDSPLTKTFSSADGRFIETNMYMPCEVGETYTFQCCTDGIWGTHDTSGTATGWTHIYLYLMTDETAVGNFAKPVALEDNPNDNLTGKRTWIYTIPDDGTVYTKIMFRFDIHSDESTEYTVSWWDLKAEKGNKATDWSPPPEDNVNGYATTDDVADAVNDVEIGGRNLLYHTKTFDGSNIKLSSEAYISGTYIDLSVCKIDISSVTSGYNDFILFKGIYPEKLGATYTFSFYAKGSGTLRTFFYGLEGYLECESITQSNGKTGTIGDGNSEWILTDTWTRYWVTWTLKTSGDISIEKYVMFRLFYGGIASICGCKLEKGNKATDWTPAPEDIDVTIDQKIAEEHTEIIKETNSIILEAVKSYVQTHAGINVVSVTNYYLASSLDTDVSSETEGWSTSIPELSLEESYLWAYETIQYSDDSTIQSQPTLIYTYDSATISEITEYYAANTDRDEPIVIVDDAEVDLDWSTSIPELTSSNLYLWHYETLTLSDETTVDTAKRYIGNYIQSYTELVESIETQLSILAGQIVMSFEDTNEQIEMVDGDLQSKFSELYKYFTFTQNGLEISAGENTMALVLDNDIISFHKNGEQFGWWDGTNFHTGNIIVDVNEKAQFGNFAFVPRSDGSLMFLKVD